MILEHLEDGGAGAGIGGNGGNGGAGANGRSESGKNGGNCGTINIWNSINVYAYGGAGGSGGKGTDYGQYNNTGPDGTAGAGGGYPGAGIGGGGAGGAGGSCCSGGGGYSGGTGEENKIDQGINGGNGSYNSHRHSDKFQSTTIGFGYFSASNVDVTDNNLSINNALAGIGGLGGTGCDSSHIAGKGGTIKVSQNANIFAYNGNRYTDGTSYNAGENQTPIYLQNGIVTAKYKHGNNTTWDKTSLSLTSSFSTITKTGYINNSLATKIVTINDNLYYTKADGTKIYFLKNIDMTNQGIGSGAGYLEVSNGTYKIDSSLN